MRSGYLNIGKATPRFTGESGYVWSNTASAKRFDDTIKPSVFSLLFAGEVITSSGPDYRWYALSLRGLGSGGEGLPATSWPVGSGTIGIIEVEIECARRYGIIP